MFEQKEVYDEKEDSSDDEDNNMENNRRKKTRMHEMKRKTQSRCACVRRPSPEGGNAGLCEDSSIY